MLDSFFDKIMGGPEKRAAVNKIAATINIPSQPQIMSEINRELDKKDADFAKIGQLVTRDVGMSAKLLKVANSPLYAPKTRVESIDQALLMLGVKQFKQTIFSSAFRQTLSSSPKANEQFWMHSEEVGMISEAISREFFPDLAEHAYLTGLFHDCAIPILLERGSGYEAMVSRVLARDRDVAKDEEQECEVEHGSMGLVMTRSWSVPIEVVRAVRAHHSDDFMGHGNEEVSRLHAILAVAENYFSYVHSMPNEIFGPKADGAFLEKLQTPMQSGGRNWSDLGKLLNSRLAGRVVNSDKVS